MDRKKQLISLNRKGDRPTLAHFLEHCTYQTIYQQVAPFGSTLVFSGPCLITGEPVEVELKAHDLFMYNLGAKIQDAFPYINSAKREWMMTGSLPFVGSQLGHEGGGGE